MTQEQDNRPSGAVGLSNMQEAFRTTMSGSGHYVMTFKFPNLETLHAADDEWHAFRKDQECSTGVGNAGANGADANVIIEAAHPSPAPTSDGADNFVDQRFQHLMTNGYFGGRAQAACRAPTSDEDAVKAAARAVTHFVAREDGDAQDISAVQYISNRSDLIAHAAITAYNQARPVEGLVEALGGVIGRYQAAVSWIDHPFVDEQTSEQELRQRIEFCLVDASRAAIDLANWTAGGAHEDR